MREILWVGIIRIPGFCWEAMKTPSFFGKDLWEEHGFFLSSSSFFLLSRFCCCYECPALFESSHVGSVDAKQG